MLLLAGAAASGCSGGADAASPTASASVTQTAPSVWSPARSSLAAAPADGRPGSSSGPATTDTSPLPGLSEHCSAAIRAQGAVTDLFSRSLSSAVADASTSPAASPAATTTTAAPRPALTADDVSRTFAQVDALAPPALGKDFAALHRAAQTMAKKPATAVPDILDDASVTDAMKSISDYIARCQPPTTG